MKDFISGAVLAVLTLTAQAGEPAGPHDGAEWQIWAYSSAAPAPLGTNATVLGLDGTVLREGSNGWTCMVGIRGQLPKEVGAARIRLCPSVPTTWV